MGAILSPTARGQYPPVDGFSLFSCNLRTVCRRAALGVVPTEVKKGTACIDFRVEGSFGEAKLAGRVGFYRQIPIYVRQEKYGVKHA